MSWRTGFRAAAAALAIGVLIGAPFALGQEPSGPPPKDTMLRPQDLDGGDRHEHGRDRDHAGAEASSTTRPTLPKKTGPFGPICYHFATIWLSEGRVHHLGGPIVGSMDQMAIDIERDRGAGVPNAAGHGEDVNTSRDQHARVSVP